MFRKLYGYHVLLQIQQLDRIILLFSPPFRICSLLNKFWHLQLHVIKSPWANHLNLRMFHHGLCHMLKIHNGQLYKKFLLQIWTILDQPIYEKQMNVRSNKIVPTVSQIWSLMTWLLILRPKLPNSTPIVTWCSYLNSLSITLFIRHDLPTPVSPIIISLKRWS